MRRFIPVPTKSPSMTVLFLLPVLVLVLGGCGGGGTSGGGGATSTKSTAGGATSASTTAGGTVPSEMRSATVDLTPSQNSGVSGTAALTDTSNGVEVVLNVQNLQDQPGTEHLAHIHEGGTCADDRAGNEAPVQYPLNSVFTEQGGTGTSTTTIRGVTVAQLFSGAPKYINVHAEKTGDETPPGISCADLSSKGDNTTSGAG